MSKISVMNSLLANKIAAGEVVERCMSVVKELVENSIDAKSTEIKIELIDAGTKQIKVIDNGVGMDKEDAVLCFGLHATSKIKTEDDLFHIETLGFRGEALSSIASVSQVTLKTSDGVAGTTVKIDGGEIIQIENSDLKQGTTITINNLFYNTPARLKYMKSLYTELASITDYVNKISFSKPNIKFVLINNDSTILNTDGSDNLLKNIKCVYGLDVAKKMEYIEGSDDDYQIKGFISIPEIHRSNKNAMVTLVNGRVVRNTEINRVINDAYHSYKPDNRYPIVILNIEVDSSLVDVNIHPTKMDIKFSKMDNLSILIENMISSKLKKDILIPSVEIEEKQEKKEYKELTLQIDRISEKEEEYVLIQEEKQVENPLFKFEEKIEIEKDKNDRLPELYPVGLVHGTYIICQNEIGMYIIDQHAAKERINYELFKKKLGNPSNNSARLLFPLTFELANNEFIILKENMDILKNIGFEVEEFGINSIIVKAHPTWLLKGYEKESIQKIIDVVISTEKNFNIEKFNESIATMLSCKLAIKANQNITGLEMEQLINDLRKCDNPFNCPHGRPTIIKYDKSDLEKLFKRSGF